MIGRIRDSVIPRPGRAGKWRRLAIIALLAGMVVGEVGAFIHRVNHESSPHAGICLLCVAADHLAAPISEYRIEFASFTPALEPVERALAHATIPSYPYRSRAPPRS
jgi:hypothetical protein